MSHPEPGQVELLLDFSALTGKLMGLTDEAVAVGGDETVVDCFLLAAGLTQICDDYLHRSLDTFDKIAAHSRSLKGAPTAIMALKTATVWSRTIGRRERAISNWTREMAVLVSQVAGAVLERETALQPALADALRRHLGKSRKLSPSLLRTVVRFPHCFLSFDQRPADCEELVRLFVERWPDRARPVLVVGLRSAGSWLGPLCAAGLRAEGFHDVNELTLRPGQDWLPAESERLEQARRADAFVLLVDEPPRLGQQLAQAAEQVARLGFSRDNVVIAAQLFGPMELVSEGITRYPHVLLPWDAWAIHRDLNDDAVRGVLTDVLAGVVVRAEPDRDDFRIAAVVGCVGVDRERIMTQHKRGHVRAQYRVSVVDDAGRDAALQICVEGVGVGYLGRPAVAVAERLAEFVPVVYGLRAGLLYREWLQDDRRLVQQETSAAPEIYAGPIASYVVARAAALPASEDMSSRLGDRGAVWELVAALLGDAFGRAKQFVRPLVRRAARQLLVNHKPSVIDGSMTIDHWFRTDQTRARKLVKVDFIQRAYSNQDAYSYDPLFDLAGVAADGRAGGEESDTFTEALLREYETLTQERIPSARWLLYQLVHYDSRARGKLTASIAAYSGDEVDLGSYVHRSLELDRLLSRACQEYFRAKYFADLTVPQSGPVCAIDIDWVLETPWRSFPSMSPSSAVALRALNLHGQRAVLVTGRSIGELRDRCRAYGLAGGVAEYGAVIYDHRTGQSKTLLDDAEVEVLSELRAQLDQRPDVFSNPFFEHTVRAHSVRHGKTAGVSRETIDEILAEAGLRDSIRVIEAASQTDFVPKRIDKALGVRAMLSQLEPGLQGSERPLALAIGDTIEDLPMLKLASRPFAPSNATAALREASKRFGIRISRRSAQRGLLDAVTRTLGHDPAGCSTCRPVDSQTSDDQLLEAVLRALDGGMRGKLTQAFRLAQALRDVA